MLDESNLIEFLDLRKTVNAEVLKWAKCYEEHIHGSNDYLLNTVKVSAINKHTINYVVLKNKRPYSYRMPSRFVFDVEFRTKVLLGFDESDPDLQWWQEYSNKLTARQKTKRR